MTTHHQAALSIVVPMYREANRIGATLRDIVATLPSLGPESEVILVDDGSTDRTLDVVEQTLALEPPEVLSRFRVLRHSINGGKAAAVRTGMLASRYGWVLMMDADNSTPLGEVGKLLEAAADVHIGMVAGIRDLSRQDVRTSSLRRPLSKIFRAVTRAGLRVPIRDTQCGFKLYRRELALMLADPTMSPSQERGWLFDLEHVVIIHRLGWEVREVPVRWAHSEGGSMRPFRQMWTLGLGLARLILRLRRRGSSISPCPMLPAPRASGQRPSSSTALEVKISSRDGGDAVRTRSSAGLLATALLFLGGCASLDPSPDLRRAGGVVAERSGLSVDWTVPWVDRAASWDGRSPLSVEQAAVMALANNRALRAQIEQIAAGRADLVQAGLLPNPVLSLALRFPVDPVAGYSQVGATVVQDLVSLWLRPSRVRAADARLNETVLSVSDAALRLVADVKASHARLVFTQRAIGFTRQNIAMVERSIEALQSRVRGGEGTPLDPNRARQQLLALRADLALQERELDRERRKMLLLIGHANAGAAWSVTEEHSDDHPVHRPLLPAALEESAVMDLATSQRLDVAAARAVVEARAAELTEQERSRIKSLGLGLAFEQTEEKTRFVGPDLEIAIPIFDINQAQIAKAGSLARASLAAFEDTAQRAITAARVAFVEAQSTESIAAEFRHGLIAIAETNLELASKSVAAGQDDVTVLLEAQRGVIEARIRLNELERDAAIARIALEYAVGGRLPGRGDGNSPQPAVEGGAP